MPKSKASKARRITRKGNKAGRFDYAANPRSTNYSNGALHRDFRTLVNSPEAAEAHKFLKAAAALEGVPMKHLQRLSPTVRAKLRQVIGDNKLLESGMCKTLRKDMIDVAFGFMIL